MSTWNPDLVAEGEIRFPFSGTTSRVPNMARRLRIHWNRTHQLVQALNPRAQVGQAVARPLVQEEAPSMMKKPRGRQMSLRNRHAVTDRPRAAIR